MPVAAPAPTSARTRVPTRAAAHTGRQGAPARGEAAARPQVASRPASRGYSVMTPALARPTTPAYAPARPRAYAPAYTPAEEPRHRAPRHPMSPATSADARPVQPATRQRVHARAAIAARSTVSQFPANLDWPSSFDDWMIDIMRRRALRLNSGARRRGAAGSVRAVELAHIMEHSRDGRGHWICAICHLPVTLDDLSFDHIVALADGGEHAAHNLAPSHRKCNEIKGSEKAQYRAQSLDRWLTEWASGQRSPGVPPSLGFAAGGAASAQQPRYA